MRAVDNTDAVYETKIDGNKISGSSQTYGIMLWQDSSHYLRFEFWSYNGRVYPAAWQVIGTASSGVLKGPSLSLGTANSLRVTRQGNTYTLEYSTNGGTSWKSAGSFSVGLTVKQAGVYVINAVSNPSTTAYFDSFSIK
jgi:hypothetical protein